MQVNIVLLYKLIKLYIRYVHDTLLLVKRQYIDKVLKAFNGFDKNLKFTVDRFVSETPHFLDLEICPKGLAIFRKNTHTGQYIDIDSFTLWKWKTTCIRSLTDRANRDRRAGGAKGAIAHPIIFSSVVLFSSLTK